MLGCNTKQHLPNVSGIKIAIQVNRFDKDLFSIDTNNIPASLSTLEQKYPNFLKDFLTKNPYGNVNYIYDQMLRLGHKFSRDQIRNQLKNIRQSIYPSDNNLVFTPSYCTCLQSNDYQTLFQARIIIPSHDSKSINKKGELLKRNEEGRPYFG